MLSSSRKYLKQFLAQEEIGPMSSIKKLYSVPAAWYCRPLGWITTVQMSSSCVLAGYLVTLNDTMPLLEVII